MTAAVRGAMRCWRLQVRDCRGAMCCVAVAHGGARAFRARARQGCRCYRRSGDGYLFACGMGVSVKGLASRGMTERSCMERDSNPRLTDYKSAALPIELSSGGYSGIEPGLRLAPPLHQEPIPVTRNMRKSSVYATTSPRAPAGINSRPLNIFRNVSDYRLFNGNSCMRMTTRYPCPAPGHSAFAPHRVLRPCCRAVHARVPGRSSARVGANA